MSHKAKTLTDFAKRISSLGLRSRNLPPQTAAAVEPTAADASTACVLSDFADDDGFDHERKLGQAALFRAVGLHFFVFVVCVQIT